MNDSCQSLQVSHSDCHNISVILREYSKQYLSSTCDLKSKWEYELATMLAKKSSVGVSQKVDFRNLLCINDEECKRGELHRL